MKKSVAVILVFAFIAFILAATHGLKTLTGLQVLELPEPPPPPGMAAEKAAPTPKPAPPPVHLPAPTAEAADILEGAPATEIGARLDIIEKKLAALDLLPAWEQRLNTAEAQAAIAANVVERLDSMQSQIDALQVEMGNLRQRPFVDQPTFFDGLNEVKGSIKRNTILSISLSVLVLIILIAMITSILTQRKKEYVSDKKLLRQYLLNYQKAGYRLESLRMHLRASGWSDWFIDDVMKELPK